MDYGVIHITRAKDASNYNNLIADWNNTATIPYTKYTIKETDFRVKTATFTTPQYLDLTTGQYYVLISSKYHENFAGIVLENEFDEETALYTYQCQDWTRKWINKFEGIYKNIQLYKLLRVMISNGVLTNKKKASRLS